MNEKFISIGEKKREGETNWREAKALGTHDLPTILLVDSVLYIMFLYNEKMVLWL
jgi:hypothetical protein